MEPNIWKKFSGVTTNGNSDECEGKFAVSPYLGNGAM